MLDFSIIGGGIVGTSVAWQLQRRNPDARIVLFEKETALARHQSGRNSGVIHSGIYYEPGSLKARFCKAGVEATVAFCEEYEIPYRQCGKLIVATTAEEEQRLATLLRRGKAADLPVERLDEASLTKLEPNIRGRGALFIGSTGIVDYASICRRMADEFEQAGGEIRFGREVSAIKEHDNRIEIGFSDGSSTAAAFLIACGGLGADRLVDMQALEADFRIIPYRGAYYRLAKERQDIVRHLIYPVPDPALPFLGVHLTPTINGDITVGPSAMQAFKREGYAPFSLDFRDTWEMLRYPGFWKISGKYWRTGLGELRDALFKSSYLERIRKYCPAIGPDDLEPHPSGVRAMAVTRDGTMLHDFLFAESPRSVHVCNAPSPAATSAIPIAEHVCERIEEIIG